MYNKYQEDCRRVNKPILQEDYIKLNATSAIEELRCKRRQVDHIDIEAFMPSRSPQTQNEMHSAPKTELPKFYYGYVLFAPQHFKSTVLKYNACVHYWLTHSYLWSAHIDSSPSAHRTKQAHPILDHCKTDRQGKHAPKRQVYLKRGVIFLNEDYRTKLVWPSILTLKPYRYRTLASRQNIPLRRQF